MVVNGSEEMIASLETLILLLTFSKKKYPHQLKSALKCAVNLCEAKREHCEIFVELLGSRLKSVEGNVIYYKEIQLVIVVNFLKKKSYLITVYITSEICYKSH